MNYEEATEMLKPALDKWKEGHALAEKAKADYFKAARDAGVRLCDGCHKPMPDYDHSQYCDGCNLPWGWATPKGQRELRAAELDRKIQQLSAERAKL